jgi:hypothetical protein
MAKHQKNAVPTLPLTTPASTTPAAVAAPAATPVVKATKMARKQAEALVAAGIITVEQLAEMEKKELVTSGDGGGLSIKDQMTKAGADAADVKLLEEVLERITKAIKGKKDEKSREIIGVSAWVKHKAEEKAADATPAATK